MSTQIEAALIAGVVGLLTAGTGALFSSMQNRRERSKWIVDLKAQYSLDLFKHRLDTYPRLFETLKLLSHACPTADMQANALVAAKEINAWIYSSGGMSANAPTRGAILALRHACEEWGASGNKPSGFYQWRNLTIEMLRRDLDLYTNEAYDFEHLEPLFPILRAEAELLTSTRNHVSSTKVDSRRVGRVSQIVQRKSAIKTITLRESLSHEYAGGRALARRIGAFPALFGCLYLCLIPIFASIYRLMPQDFYHPTAQYEPAFLREKQGLANMLVSEIQREEVSVYKTTSVKSGDVTISDLRLPTMTFGSDTFSLQLKCSAQNSKAGTFSDFYVELTFQTLPNLKVVVLGKTSTKTSYYRFPMVDQQRPLESASGLQDFNAMTLFPRGRLELTPSENRRISAIDQAAKGFPSRTPGSFLRMFYLSGMTITTVGYGDIVPATDTARVLVMLEAVIGIVVIGLFLSSLAARIGRANSGLSHDPDVPPSLT